MTDKKINPWIRVLSYEIGLFLMAMSLMFALALVRKDIPGMPAVGYWGAFGIVWVGSIVGSLLRGMSKE